MGGELYIGGSTLNIVEATKKADSEHAIRRKNWRTTMRLVPTDSTFLTSVFANDSICNVRWEPSKDDLIAEDWEIIPISLENIDPLKLAKMLGKPKVQLTRKEFYKHFSSDHLIASKKNCKHERRY